MTTIIQFKIKTPRKTEKMILEILFSRKPVRSNRNTKNIAAKHTIKTVFSILLISENLNILLLIIVFIISQEENF